MSHAEICPVCAGKGRIKDEGRDRDKPCHGCGGFGWITVQDPGNVYFTPPEIDASS